MRNHPTPKLGALSLRVCAALALSSMGVVLAVLSFVPHKAIPQRTTGPTLATRKLTVAQRAMIAQRAAIARQGQRVSQQSEAPAGPLITPIEPPPNTPTFGHPIISGVGGLGFEQDIRLDPTNPNRIYTSVPGTLSADTSWIWHSLDGGKTFKWIPNAIPLEGKVTTCHGGGDTELAVDPQGRLYFNDLTLANFSTARSDDGGITFVGCSNTGVPDTIVDRQWYAIDGDPLNGGSIYLTNDEVGPGAPVCGSSQGNNVLVMYRSPIDPLVASATAGIQFGPANQITPPLQSCDEAIMGNNEVSPVATTLGQPISPGVYATLPTPVKHVYVIHDDATLHKILIARCFPVAFGLPVPNMSDPSGLNCTDILVADLGPNVKTGGDFPTMAIDKAGNLYTVWEQAPNDANGNVTGDTVLKYSYSTDQGNTWAAPIAIDTSGSPLGTLHNNVFAWMVAGDDGRVNIVWYGTTAPSNSNDAVCGANSTDPLPPLQGTRRSGPDSANGLWYLWMVQTLNAHDPVPIFTAPILASEHHVHRGSIQTLMGGQCGNRSQGDFLQVRMGSQGEAHISYADSNNIFGAATTHAMYVRQNGGNGLLAANSPVNILGHTPYNSATDPSGDGKYEVNGRISENMPQLDILNSSVTKVTTAPCTVAVPCYKVVMQLNNLSLAPTPVDPPGDLTDDPDTVLIWQTQWLVPSTTDPNGGKNFMVYAESDNGAALRCFVGENALQFIGGGGALTYPGRNQLLAANCQSTLGPNGNITIYVPVAGVSEPGAIDSRLHEVTATTMTMQEPANTVPDLFGIGVGGTFFNLIDVVQGYTFDSTVVKAVSRKTHGAVVPPFEVDLPLSGAPGIESRTGQGVNSNNHQVVVTFTAPATFPSISASVTSGTGTVSGTSVTGNEVRIDLTGVANEQTIAITLFGVNDGTGPGNLVIPMSLLAGDVVTNKIVSNTDVAAVKAQISSPVTASNFRADVNANGIVSNTDVSVTKAQVSTTLP